MGEEEKEKERQADSPADDAVRCSSCRGRGKPRTPSVPSIPGGFGRDGTATIPFTIFPKHRLSGPHARVHPI